MLRIEQVFAASEQNLWYEFLETLINDPTIPEKLRRQIWAFSTIDLFYNTRGGIEVLIQQEFDASEDPKDLTNRWQQIVNSCWHLVPDCPLKRELDAL